MNEWTRQCGYEVSLLRFYPYFATNTEPSSPNGPSLPSTPQKIAHAHKVERLIHLELAEMRVKRGCENCRKEHREWFEVEGSREGLRSVDGVVRRWVEWDQRTSM